MVHFLSQDGRRRLYYDRHEGVLWCERSDTGSDMDVDSNAPTPTEATLREASPVPGTGGIDDRVVMDDPDIALAARIAVSVGELCHNNVRTDHPNRDPAFRFSQLLRQVPTESLRSPVPSTVCPARAFSMVTKVLHAAVSPPPVDPSNNVAHLTLYPKTKHPTLTRSWCPHLIGETRAKIVQWLCNPKMRRCRTSGGRLVVVSRLFTVRRVG